MLKDKYQNTYRIPTARAPWHTYDNGCYFVTICTANRKCFFGQITNPVTMNLSTIGKYAHEQFSKVSEHYPYAKIPVFVIMPNHIHAIVLVDGHNIPYTKQNAGKCGNTTNENDCEYGDRDCEYGDRDCRDGARTVSTIARWKSSTVDKNMQNISRCKGPLSVVIGGIKSAVTKYAHEKQIPFAWQTRFHDRIIRNQNQMDKIAQYIERNVAKWYEIHGNVSLP
ncbi:MAG: hypothetical protein MJZ76_04465 [Bacteroidales bacterium]|nr:hypothetical protein [Bacteroidales bacterium]